MIMKNKNKKDKLSRRYIDLFYEVMKISMACECVTDFKELDDVCEENGFNHKLVFYNHAEWSTDCDYYVYYITDKGDNWTIELWSYKEDYKTFKVTNIDMY